MRGVLMVRTAPRVAEPAAAALLLRNLLNDAPTLAELLVDRCETGQWLDAYLLAAGIDQILEDGLHPDPLALNRIATRLRRGSKAMAARVAAAAAGSGRAVIWRARAPVLASSTLAQCQREISVLVADLARLLCGGENRQPRAEEERASDFQRRAREVRQKVGALPSRVRETPLRLPSCFLHLDQYPQDVETLIAEVVERWPDRSQPALILGVRTSGSYLAPLAAAALSAAGYREVRQMTMRPRQLWLPQESRLLRWALKTGARVLVLDDPPNTWATIVNTVTLLRRVGFPATSIVPLVQTFPSTPPTPDALRDHPIVTLPRERTQVQQQLDPAAIRAALAELLPDGSVVEAVERLPLADNGARAHARALYEASIRPPGGPAQRKAIYVQGVGLGYLGLHALAVGEPLQGFVPRLYGVSQGLLFREWLPEDDRLHASEELESVSGKIAEEIADYVFSRARALPVAEDMAWRLKDRSSVWRALGRFLAHPFGRLEVAFWPLTERAVRALLAVERPSVVDARMGPSGWFLDRHDGGLKKIGFVGRTFSGYDLYCYDPVFDLAGAAASSESDALEERLRARYSMRTGSAVDAERWLLYQLLHLSGQDLDWDELADPELERRMSRRIQRYLGDVFFKDLRSPREGPLCAIDVDGVLESAPLGISASSADGMRALRALQLHGYRPVLVSGRSLSEVRDRCIHYRLAGGVAEYGAAIYLTEGDLDRKLLTGEELGVLESLRAGLSRLPDVLLDGAYETAVRAYRHDGRGRRRALSPEQVEAGVAGLHADAVRAVHGAAQTDFVVARVTKATGVAALAEALGPQGSAAEGPALAIGDTVSDLPVLTAARLAFAPGNARQELREAGVQILDGHCEAGLKEAVTRLLGHQPASCPVCRDPRLSARTRLLLTFLDGPRKETIGAKAAWAMGTTARLAWLTAVTGRGTS